MCLASVSIGGLGTFGYRRTNWYVFSFIPRIRAVTGVQLLVPLVSATYALSPYLVEQQQPQGMGKHV